MAQSPDKRTAAPANPGSAGSAGNQNQNQNHGDNTATDLDTRRGQGGELQQQAGGSHPVLTTQQGIAIADNQNSLKATPRSCSTRSTS